MTITLTPEIEAGLTARAEAQGVAPERLALEKLRTEFATEIATVSREPSGDWKHFLQRAATDCGVSLTDEQVSRDSLYNDHL